jgi:integrase/recombinase XerD
MDQVSKIDSGAIGEGGLSGGILNMKMSETLEEFRRSMVVKGSRLKHTTEKYDQIMRRFIAFTGDLVIGELRVGDFGKFKYDMVIRKKKSSTIATAMSVFCKYAAFLRDHHFVKDLDIEEIRMMRPKVHQTSPEALERWAIDKLMEEATDIEDLALVHLLFYTGIRIDELLNLKEVNIREHETQGEGGPVTTKWIEVMGKGNKPREIPLSLSAEQTLMRYLRYLGDKHTGGFERLFPHSYSTYWRRLRKLGEKAGVKVSPHVLRHSFGVELLNRGEDLRRIADLMGHSDMNTTMRYTAVKDRSKIDAVNKL